MDRDLSLFGNRSTVASNVAAFEQPCAGKKKSEGRTPSCAMEGRRMNMYGPSQSPCTVAH